MKSKLLYIITIILTFQIGIISTIIIQKYTNQNQQDTNQKTQQNINITETNTIKSAIEKIYNAVVLVETYNDKVATATGTGFIYKTKNQKGYIITNRHVIEKGNKYNILLASKQEIEAQLLGSDEYLDIAVLSIPEESVLNIATIGESSNSQIGDTVFTVGSPLGKEYMGTVTKGILSSKERTITISSTMIDVLQTDAAINPGNSGGPLVNINGEVIGVNSMKLVEKEVEGMGFAIPIETVTTILNKLETGEQIIRPQIGIEMTDINNTQYLYKEKITIPEEIVEGIVIIKVTDNSKANQAKLQKGDIILEINNTKIKDSAHFKYLLYKQKNGDTLTIKYYRDKQIKETSINLDKITN